MTELVLSIFPGVDLLGRAFAGEGFCCVAGPDPITGGDIRDFVAAPGKFDGVIGGPPCQDFSCAKRTAAKLDGYGVEMLREYIRVITEAQPTWWIAENVPGVPDLAIEGYYVQRVPITDVECGGRQRRLRHMQFGHRAPWVIRPERLDRSVIAQRKLGRAALARREAEWQKYADHCRRQGLDGPLSLPGWRDRAKFRAVGNGVPITMGRVIARSVLCCGPADAGDCACGCGRRVTTQRRDARCATAACRKRLQMLRDKPRPLVGIDGLITDAQIRIEQSRMIAGQVGLHRSHGVSPTEEWTNTAEDAGP